MIPGSYQLKKSLRKWTYQQGRTTDCQIGPKLLIVLCTTIIVIIQLLLYQTLSSRSSLSEPINSTYNSLCRVSYVKQPTVYIITPTYLRYMQKAELTRLSHTFILVPDLHWIIVEDSDKLTPSIIRFVDRLKVEFNFSSITHLHAPTPQKYKLKVGEPSWTYPKGVWQRNRGLDWIIENSESLDSNGVIYFADDDNTYDLKLFDEMRSTRKISVWPVGFAGGMLVERPIVNPSTNSVQGFNSMWRSERPYPIDMAGFAISLQLVIKNSRARFSSQQKIGYMESHFLSQLIKTWDELEPKAYSCTRVFVWHTKAQNPALHEERKLANPSYSNITDW